MTRNPFAHLLTASGTIDRAAVMREAWRLFRAFVRGRFNRRMFAMVLRNAWDAAKQGLRNEKRREAERAFKAAVSAEQMERASRPAPVFTGPLVIEPGTLEYRHYYTDGRYFA